MRADTYDEKYERSYNNQATVYDERRFSHRKGSFDMHMKNDIIAHMLQERNLIHDKARLLDVASGTGRIVHSLVEQPVGEIVAADVSENMLEINRSKLSVAHQNRVSFIKANMKELPFDDETFDVVTLGSFYYLIPTEKYRDYTQDIYRVLKRDGIFICELSNALKLFNPISFIQVLVNKHLMKKPVTSHIYPWLIGEMFKPFMVDEIQGACFPLITSRYGIYRSYTQALNNIFPMKYFAGKIVVALRKP